MYDDFGKIGVRIAMPRPDGTLAVLTRVPCYVATRPDPSNPYVVQAAFRDKVTNRFLVTMCTREQMPEHAVFLQNVLYAAAQDESIYDFNGKSYVTACGWLMEEDEHRIVLAMESPREGYKIEYQ